MNLADKLENFVVYPALAFLVVYMLVSNMAPSHYMFYYLAIAVSVEPLRWFATYTENRRNREISSTSIRLKRVR